MKITTLIIISFLAFLAVILGSWITLPAVVTALGAATVVAIGLTVAGRPATAVLESPPATDGNQGRTQAISQIADAASRIAIGGASLSHFLDKLTSSLNTQVEHAREIAERVGVLESANDELETQVDQALTQVQRASADTHRSDTLLQEVSQQQTTLTRQIGDTSELLTRLKTQAESISQITDTINQLADQTNMLALNAAIESARAGEHGRGFSVVADEVRNLAHKTAEATQGIEQLVSQISADSSASVESIAAVSQAGQRMSELVTEVSGLIQGASTNSQDASQAMQQVDRIIKQHKDTNSGISANAQDLHRSILSVDKDLHDTAGKVLNLSHQTEGIFRHLHLFDLEDRNSLVQKIAIESAARIGKVFEQAIESGQLSKSALFGFNYQPIPKTQPQKFSTGFDRFTDQHLPAIQEPILAGHEFIIYAGAVDKNGYFPTHNKKFSQPLTGDYEKDLVANRTKRIFNDYTGARCGASREKFLLQTYKRDTGEVMHDLSAPIYVHGQHWGGFRVGYQANTH